MPCYICQDKIATVHLTLALREKVLKLNLCEECAKQKGINDPNRHLEVTVFQEFGKRVAAE